jgi:hypothetical protein
MRGAFHHIKSSFDELSTRHFVMEIQRHSRLSLLSLEASSTSILSQSYSCNSMNEVHCSRTSQFYLAYSLAYIAKGLAEIFA